MLCYKWNYFFRNTQFILHDILVIKFKLFLKTKVFQNQHEYMKNAFLTTYQGYYS